MSGCVAPGRTPDLRPGVFDRTLTVIKEETCRRMRAGRFEEATIYSGDIPGSKVTYPMLMGALGSDVSVCGEECCI